MSWRLTICPYCDGLGRRKNLDKWVVNHHEPRFFTWADYTPFAITCDLCNGTGYRAEQYDDDRLAADVQGDR